MVEKRSGGDAGWEEGHAIMMEGRAPLSERGMDSIEDVIRILDYVSSQLDHGEELKMAVTVANCS